MRRIEVDNFKVYFTSKGKLNDSFFVPDSKSWSFVVESIDKKMLIYELLFTLYTVLLTFTLEAKFWLQFDVI